MKEKEIYSSLKYFISWKAFSTGSISASPEVKFNFPGLNNTDTFNWNSIESVKEKN